MDPKRLVDDDDLGAALLASARGDAPGRHARDRAAAALGLAIGAAAATGSTSAAAGTAGAGGSIAPGAAAGAGAAVATKAAGVGLVAKIVAAVLVVGAIGGGTAVVTRASRHGATTTASPSPPNATATAAANASPATTAESAPAPEATAIPAAPSAAAHDPAIAAERRPGARPARAISTGASAEPSASPLSRELHSLDTARRALADGDPNGALAALDAHDRAFPRGALRGEAQVIRAEALLARGDTAAARALARELLARDPSGPHARRLHTIADGP